MTRSLIAIAALCLTAAVSHAATVENKDEKAYTLVVTEGGQRTEIAVGAGQSMTLCNSGCFLTLPNGDRETLSGGETVEISGGRAKVK